MNKDFIKVGDRILLSRKGLDYDLKSGHVYNLMYERYEGFGYLEEDGKLTTPNRIYSSGIENELIDIRDLAENFDLDRKEFLIPHYGYNHIDPYLKTLIEGKGGILNYLEIVK